MAKKVEGGQFSLFWMINRPSCLPPPTSHLVKYNIILHVDPTTQGKYRGLFTCRCTGLLVTGVGMEQSLVVPLNTDGKVVSSGPLNSWQYLHIYPFATAVFLLSCYIVTFYLGLGFFVLSSSWILEHI